MSRPAATCSMGRKVAARAISMSLAGLPDPVIPALPASLVSAKHPALCYTTSRLCGRLARLTGSGFLGRGPAAGRPTLVAWRLALFYGAVFALGGILLPFWPSWLDAQGIERAEL